MFEYVVVLSDGTTEKIVAENIAAVLEHFNEDEVTIINIFRNSAVSETAKRGYKSVATVVYPREASETGCFSVPGYVEQLREGDNVTISAVKVAGWVFGHWEVDGIDVGNSPTMIVKVGNKDTVYRAVFKLAE